MDYDGTYTEDPELWDDFIVTAKAQGHRVLIVTARRNTEENRELVDVRGCSTIFTELASKIWHMEEKANIKIDIWIDDDPKTLVHGH